MTMRHRLSGSVVPFARRWHIIQEVDLVRLVAEHEKMAELCNRLKACADALPDWTTSEQLCCDLAQLIERDEEDEVAYLADMLDHAPNDRLIKALLNHVRLRHAADADHAHDVIAVLRVGANGDVSADTFGYMLRCFFEGCRRAVDFEELAILALAQNRLTPDARALLVEGVCRRAA